MVIRRKIEDLEVGDGIECVIGIVNLIEVWERGMKDGCWTDRATYDALDEEACFCK